MSTLLSIAPHFLVSDLQAALDEYVRVLGFQVAFQYQDFYASVGREGAEIHLKVASALAGERDHRRANQHLDAYIVVDDVHALHEELKQAGANILLGPVKQAWGRVDFYVADRDGYILCFASPGTD